MTSLGLDFGGAMPPPSSESGGGGGGDMTIETYGVVANYVAWVTFNQSAALPQPMYLQTSVLIIWRSKGQGTMYA